MIIGWFDPILGIGSRVTERKFLWLTLNSTSLSKIPCIFDKCWLRQEFSCFLHSQQYLNFGFFLGFLLFLTLTSCFFLKYGFCNKSFRKDAPLTSWTLLQHICPHFWAWLLLYSAITPKSEDKYVVKVFNWSEFHLSEMTLLQNPYFSSYVLFRCINSEARKKICLSNNFYSLYN